MKDCGELMLYIESFDFVDKKDLERQLLECMNNTTDLIALRSVKSALSTLQLMTENELKEIKGSLK